MREDSEGRALIDYEIILPDSALLSAEGVEGVECSSKVLGGSQEVKGGRKEGKVAERLLAEVEQVGNGLAEVQLVAGGLA